ncbi:hypothetical protein ABAZ39_14765 (plasmid) [Azospirillum argentinense]|uniref:DUF1194 domain-containing protein n=1 Tax=Azospirillum argentinense TaxID=2970906 RepID=A0A060DJW3_9PROT|nr:DUF1194 domain-containing protein [Azospirillum argentinense]AIB13222.1 hypothetical protein ABAZ39_14765 [Azospirillum argentinense]EZQ05026.1 hypothetical protein ABAZ39_14820 [Azospirillum argentinense]KAA1056115.1 vWFA-like protein with metal ion dependent adhesion motif (MIDAS) [Azospirillum argentinense]
MSVPTGVAAAVAATILSCGSALAAQPAVDLELVLAVDGSASIDQAMFEFELDGHAAAFRDRTVVELIRDGYRGRIAVTLVLWSDPTALKVFVPWTVIADASSGEAFAAAIDAVPRRDRAGSTGIGAALLNCATLFPNVMPAPRRVIDVVSNGYNNVGTLPEVARDRVVAEGVTINGLVILDEVPWLGAYFAQRVIGGSGAFVHSVADRSSFVHAITAKLKREIANAAEQESSAIQKLPD